MDEIRTDTGAAPADARNTGADPSANATFASASAAVAREPETRRFFCTTCPSECALTVEVACDGSGAQRAVGVRGNRCERGRAFAEQEITRPVRILATTVAVRGGDEHLLPVRTARPIPRDLHMRAMDEVRHAIVSAPVRMGDIVVENLLGTGVDLVASMDVDALP